MPMEVDKEDASDVYRATWRSYHIHRIREGAIRQLLDSSGDPNFNEEKILEFVSDMKKSVALVLMRLQDSLEFGEDELEVMNKEESLEAVHHCQGTDFGGSSGKF